MKIPHSLRLPLNDSPDTQAVSVPQVLHEGTAIALYNSKQRAMLVVLNPTYKIGDRIASPANLQPSPPHPTP